VRNQSKNLFCEVCMLIEKLKSWQHASLRLSPHSTSLFLPGAAFGELEAGTQPTQQPQNTDNAVTKALRTAGFPDTEQKIVPSNIVSKVTSGIQKRTLKMEELIAKFQEVPSTSLGDKILLFCFGCSLVCIELFSGKWS